MSKLSSKISVPIILAGIFAITIFIAVDYDKLDFKFYIILFLLTVFMFFFGFATGQNISSPVKKLLDRANDLKNGNLSSRVYLETKDELAEQAKAFNQIAEEMESSKSLEEKTEKSVDIKVRARTQELNDTIDALEQKVKNRTVEHNRLMAEAQKLQQQTKAKEDEMAQIKKELNDIKSKIGRANKQRPAEENNKNNI